MKILFSNGRRVKNVDFFLTGKKYFGNWGKMEGLLHRFRICKILFFYVKDNKRGCVVIGTPSFLVLYYYK